jgi:hypothetical protein
MFWGIVSILGGSLLSLGVVRILFRFNWRLVRAEDTRFLTGLLPFSALAVFLIWLGKNELQRASGQEVPKPRVRWGRLVLGFWIAFFSVRSHFAPGPGALRASNEAEAAGMLTMSIMLTCLGLVLMVLAFASAKRKSMGADDQKTPE